MKNYSTGWIKVYRSFTEDELYFSQPFYKNMAWIELLILAEYKPNGSNYFIREVTIHVKRGQVSWSQEKLAERWKWSRGKVIRFLNYLETTGKIIQQRIGVINTRSIIKYNEYQSNSTIDRTIPGTF